MTGSERILVIRLSALGDMILCMQAFHEIRRAHPNARIALLTTPAFVSFARTMPWFDEIIVDERAPASRPDLWLGLLKRVRNFAPTRVYDLQGMNRQGVLYYLLGGPLTVEWSGAAALCSHPRPQPQSNTHFCDFVAAQLRHANVPPAEPADLSWLDATVHEFNLPARFALFVPGCGPGRDYKRWPSSSFAEIAHRLQSKNLICMTVGTKADEDAIQALRHQAPEVIDLSGRTTLHQLAAIARRAVLALGNDSGPTHLMAAVGTPTLALISEHVNPIWSSPRGARAAWLQGHPLSQLGVEEVFLALNRLLDKNNGMNIV